MFILHSLCPNERKVNIMIHEFTSNVIQGQLKTDGVWMKIRREQSINVGFGWGNVEDMYLNLVSSQMKRCSE